MSNISNGRKLYDTRHTQEGRAAARTDRADENGGIARGRKLYDELHPRRAKETNK